MESATKTNLVEVNINDLNKDPNHPRQERGDLEALTKSIRHDGIMNPIVVQKIADGSYHILDGDRRVEVAKTLDYETVPCIVYEGLTPGESAHKSYILNTERNQLSPIDKAHHIKRMRDEFGYTLEILEIMGYGSRSQISKILHLLDLPEKIQEDIINGRITAAHGEALRKLKDPAKIERTAKLAIGNEWSAKKTGDTIDRINRKAKKESKKEEPKADVPAQEVPGVYFKDATDMSEQPDGSVALIVTNPDSGGGDDFNGHLDNIESVMKESARVLAPGGVIAINAADILDYKGPKGKNRFTQILPMVQIYQKALRKHGVYLQDQVIWAKGPNSNGQDIDNANTAHTTTRIIASHEPVYIFRKEGERQIPTEKIVLASALNRPERETYAQSVWTIPAVQAPEGHTSILPEEIPARLIKMFSFVGDSVLDPFLGTGTTIKVARELGRDGVGYERDHRYKETIMKKLGVAKESEAEGVAAHSQKVLDELEANQPVKPEEDLIEEDERDYSALMFGRKSNEKTLEHA